MGTCKNHPDRDASYVCVKHDYHLCSECLHCKDPEIYCKFRTSCVIYFLTEKGGSAIDRNDAAQTQQP